MLWCVVFSLQHIPIIIATIDNNGIACVFMRICLRVFIYITHIMLLKFMNGFFGPYHEYQLNCFDEVRLEEEDKHIEYEKNTHIKHL